MSCFFEKVTHLFVIKDWVGKFMYQNKDIFQGMGKWIPSLAISIVRQVVLLMPLLVILQALMGEFGLICAQPIADTVTLLVGVVLYVSLMRKTKNNSSQSL